MCIENDEVEKISDDISKIFITRIPKWNDDLINSEVETYY